MKTAVEWLIEEIEQKGDAWENVSISRIQISIKVEDYLELKNQAKEMEKEQIVEAYNQGSEAGYELAKNDDFIEGYKTKEAEHYYNETFKSE